MRDAVGFAALRQQPLAVRSAGRAARGRRPRAGRVRAVRQACAYLASCRPCVRAARSAFSAASCAIRWSCISVSARAASPCSIAVDQRAVLVDRLRRCGPGQLSWRPRSRRTKRRRSLVARSSQRLRRAPAPCCGTRGWRGSSRRRCARRRAARARRAGVRSCFRSAGVALLRRLERAAAFEQRHDREQLVGVVLGQLGDPAALARHQRHQPFGGEHLERLAQRRAADLPLARQRQLVDPVPGAELALEHHRAQPRGDFLVQRGAAQRCRLDHGSESTSL